MPGEVRGLSPGIQFNSGQSELPIACFRCGLCCNEYRIGLSSEEAERIASKLGLAFREFWEEYIDHEWLGREGFFFRKAGNDCIFLKREGPRQTHCLINDVKPESCRKWQASLFRRECRRGLAECWGLTVSLSGKLEGTPAKLKRFHEFMESLSRET